MPTMRIHLCNPYELLIFLRKTKMLTFISSYKYYAKNAKKDPEGENPFFNQNFEQNFEKDLEEKNGTNLLTEEKTKLKKPNMYCVFMINDNYTTMEFVTWIIQMIFHKSLQEATRLMLDVHTKGRGLMGVFTYDVARTKVEQVLAIAEKNEHPLQCILEAEVSDE